MRIECLQYEIGPVLTSIIRLSWISWHPQHPDSNKVINQLSFNYLNQENQDERMNKYLRCLLPIDRFSDCWQTRKINLQWYQGKFFTSWIIITMANKWQNLVKQIIIFLTALITTLWAICRMFFCPKLFFAFGTFELFSSHNNHSFQCSA